MTATALAKHLVNDDHEIVIVEKDEDRAEARIKAGIKPSLGQVFLPLVLGLEILIGDVEGELAGGWRGVVQQLHAGFFRRPPGLAPVAGYTGADHVLPGVLTTPVSGNDMV